jgi:hypothetical protein
MLCAKACLLLPKASPDLLLNYLHRLALLGVVFKNTKEVVGHGNDFAFLGHEQLVLLLE